MKTTLTKKQLREKITEKSKLVDTIFTEAGDDVDFTKVKCLGEGDTTAKVEKIRQLNLELSEYKDDMEEFKALEEARRIVDESVALEKGLRASDSLRPDLNEGPGQFKTLGEQFVEKGLTDRSNWHKSAVSLDVDLKTIVQTGAGWSPESPRLPRVEMYPLKTPKVADAFPVYNTSQSDIKYMYVSTWTNNANEVSEETDASSPTAYGEAALAMTEASVPIEKIAVWIPVTEEQLEDVEGAGGFINSSLVRMVRDVLDTNLISGDGSTPNIRGVLNASGIQSQARGSDPRMDAVFKAITKIRGVTAGTGFAEPNAAIFHPNDWQDIRLTRTADGIYIMGSPTEPGPERLWGVPVIITPAETENTVCVGDFNGYSGLYVKRNISVEVTNSHGELFTAGVLAIKATMRCAAVYFRGSAFCKVTGM